MTQRIKSYLFSIAATLMLLVSVLVPTVAFAADCSTIAGQVSSGANGAASGTATGDCSTSSGVSGGDIATAAHDIVDIFSIIVGVVAVIMIIYGGFRYITSGGDSGRVGNAKNSLIYAIVGLIIVALAQLIVHFVLNQTSNIGT